MSNRSLADMDFFGDSATRQNEGNENIENQNNNETLKQHNDNVNDNVNINEKTTDANNNEPPEVPSEKKEITTNNTDPKIPEVPEAPEDIPPGNTPGDIPKDPSPEDIKQEDILDFLKVDQEKKVVGFHLDKDVRQAFQKVLGKKPQRGAQSELANRIFRDFFEKRGLL